MNRRLEAGVFLGLTAFVALFQAALILGAPWGHLTQGGQHDGALPAGARVMAGVSILVLGLMARIVAERAGMARALLPSWTIRIVIGYLIVAVVLHVLTPSAEERALWLPVVGVQLACAWRVARG